jgi:predicted dehydrogenase
MMADLFKAISAGTQFTPDFEDGYRNQVVLDAVEKSADSRQWVSISE